MSEPIVRYNVYSGVEDNYGKWADGPWSALVQWLLNTHIESESKHAVELFNLTAFRDRRCKAGALSAQAMILDFDHLSGTDLAEVRGRLLPYECVWYTTHSYNYSERAVRCVLLLDKAADPDTFNATWQALQDMLGGKLDAKCRDISHFYYLPSHAPGHEFWAEYNPGAPFQTVQGVQTAKQAKADYSDATQKMKDILESAFPAKGERRDAYMALSGALAKWGWSQGQTTEYLLQVHEALGWDGADQVEHAIDTTYAAVEQDIPHTGYSRFHGLVVSRLGPREDFLKLLDELRLMFKRRIHPGLEITPTVDDTIRALAAADIYQRSGSLVEIGHTARMSTTGIIRPQGSTVVKDIALTRLVEIIDQRAAFFGKTKKNEERQLPVARHIAEHVSVRPAWPNIRPLMGFTTWPVMRPDGSILQDRGYDPQTGLYCENQVQIYVPSTPTQQDAIRARERLDDLVCDFPFINPAHRAVWLSMLLSAVARPAIAGPCPMVLFEASERSSGKTKLAELIGIITAGNSLARSGVSSDNEENRKNMLAIALAADPIVLFDNVKGLFRNQPLEQVLTGGSFKDRVLGTNTTREVEMRTIFCMTSNNALLEEDFVTRSLLCRLVPNTEHPETRSNFRYPHIEAHTAQHRSEYLSAALTMLRAYVVAGRPAVTRGMNRYPDWSELVQSTLIWAGAADPVETQAALRETASDEKGALGDMLQAWKDLFGPARVTVKELLTRARMPGGEVLLDAMTDVCQAKTSDMLTGKKLSIALMQHRDRIAGGLKLERCWVGHGGGYSWRVI